MLTCEYKKLFLIFTLVYRYLCIAIKYIIACKTVLDSQSVSCEDITYLVCIIDYDIVKGKQKS